MTKLGPVQKKLQYQKNKLLKYSDVVRVKPEVPNKQIANREEVYIEEEEDQLDQYSQQE